MPGLLPSLPKTPSSHSSTCLQVEDSKNKKFTLQLCETLWVEGLGHVFEHDKINPNNKIDTSTKSPLYKDNENSQEICHSKNISLFSKVISRTKQ